METATNAIVTRAICCLFSATSSRVRTEGAAEVFFLLGLSAITNVSTRNNKNHDNTDKESPTGILNNITARKGKYP